MTQENNNHQLPVGVKFTVTDTGKGLQKLAKNIKTVNEEVSKLKDSATKIEEFGNQFSISTNNITVGTGKASKATSSLAKKIKTEYQSGIKSASDTMLRLQKTMTQTEKAISQLERRMKVGGATEEMSARYDYLTNQLSSLSGLYKKVQTDYEKYNNAINEMRKKYTDENSQRMLNELQKTMQYNQQQHQAVVNVGKQTTQAIKKENQERALSDKEYARMNEEATKMYLQNAQKQSEASKLIDKRFAINTSTSTGTDQFFASGLRMMALSKITSEFYSLGNAVSEINYNTINNQRLLGNYSDDLRDKLIDSATAISQASGILISDAQEIQGAWIRINEQYARSMTLLDGISELTAKFMNVGGIEDAEEAVKLVNASLLQFNMTSENANLQLRETEEMLSKWAYMADVTAMGTADEYGEAISGYGRALYNLRGDMDDAIVLSSILSDNLAMTGNEAKTALKTFIQYMNRPKTVTLFEQLSKDMGDASLQLVDVNGKFKDFNEIMDIVAGTYQKLMASGNEVEARKIVEALGATRRADVSTALLTTWNDATNGAQKYYDLLESQNSKNYLDKQNELLLESVSKQWSIFTSKLQEVAVVLGNNGILDMVELLLKGMSKLMDVVSNLNPIALKLISTLLISKTLKASVGMLSKYNTMMGNLTSTIKYGTQAHREKALAQKQEMESLLTAQSTALQSEMKITGNTVAVQQQAKVINYNKYAMDQLNLALASGQITLQKYTAIAQQYTMQMAKGEMITDQLTASTQANTVAQGQNVTLMETGNRVMAQTNLLSKGSAMVSSIATKATNLFAGAMGGLKAIFTSFLSPVNLVITAISFLPMLMSNSASEIENTQEKIDGLTGDIEECKARVDELKDLEMQRALTVIENEELSFLQERVELLERQVELEEKSLMYQKMFKGTKGTGWFGTGLFGESGDKSYVDQVAIDLEKVNNIQVGLTDAFERLKETQDKMEASMSKMDELDTSNISYSAEYGKYNSYSEQLNTQYEQIIDAQNELAEIQANASVIAEEIQYALDNGYFVNQNDKQKAEDTLDSLNELMGKTESSFNSIRNIIGDIATNASVIDMDEIIGSISDAYDKIFNLDESIGSFIGDELTPDELYELARAYGEFEEALTGTYEDQLKAINKYRKDLADELRDTIDVNLETLYDLYAQAEEEWKKASDEGNETVMKQVESTITSIQSKIDQLELQKTIALSIDTSGLDEFANSLNDVVSSTSDLAEAQRQLAQGTSLSKSQLFDLCMQYEELLYSAELFNDASVKGQKEAIDKVMKMKNQEYETTIDRMIDELKARRTASNSQLELEEKKYNLLSKALYDYKNGSLKTYDAMSSFLLEFNKLDYKTKMATLSAESKGTADTLTDMAGYYDDFGEIRANQDQEQWQNTINSYHTNSYKAYKASFDNYTSYRRALESAVGVSSDQFTQIWNRYHGTSYKTPATESPIASKYSYSPQDNTINGVKVDEFLSEELKNVNSNKQYYKDMITKFDIAIDNLTDMKNNYGLDKYLGDKASEDGSSSSKDKEDDSNDARQEQIDAMEDQADDIKDGLEEVSETIRDIYDDYIQSVEDLQERLVKALEKQYQEQREAREKELEDERDRHLETLETFRESLKAQKESSKEEQLTALKKRYQAWLKDDSSTGKAKQKELQEQISDLELEIRLEYVDKEIDRVEQKYDELLDPDSDSYDSKLAELDKKLNEVNLHAEANSLIANGQRDKIIDLLSKFDPDINGWASLLGNTVKDVTTKFVDTALNHYLDLLKGTINQWGGKFTNNNSTWDSSWFGQIDYNKLQSNISNSTNSAQKDYKDNYDYAEYTYDTSEKYRAWHTANGETTLLSLAKHYYNDGNKWTKIRDANHLDGYTQTQKLIKGKLIAIPFRSGGYTGNDEGLAYLHTKERVLNAQQTEAFDYMVYKILPQLQRAFVANSGNTNNTNTNYNFHQPFVSINVDKVNNNSEFDYNNNIDNFARLLQESMYKHGIRPKL